MSAFWDHVYASRVPMWVVQTVVYVVSLAVLEAGTEAARIVSLVLALLSSVFHLWYTGYVGYRLWSFIGKRYKPKPNARDYHSILIWLDIFLALMLAWSHTSQSIYTLWPDTFAIDHISHNHWVAAFEWIWSVVDTVTTNGTPFEPKHTVPRVLYAIIGTVHYFYLPVIVAIGLKKAWEHKDSEKEHDLESAGGAPNAQQQSLLPTNTIFQRSAIASFASSPPPSVYPSSDPGPSSNAFVSWYATAASRGKPMTLSAQQPFHDVYAWTG